MRALSFIALFLLLSFENFAQAPNYIFYNTGERQGLSANFCYRLLKDSRGMLWVGTVNGLSRFDGVHFNNFKAGKDSGSFINNEIFDLCEDKEGNIWGATASGIFRYNAAANSFKNYIPPTYDFARGVANIICDQRGDIWATTAWNILKLNKTKNSFEEIGPLTHHKDSLNAYSVRPNGLVEDPLGKGLWFATRSGLHFYNTAQQKFFGYRNSPGDSLFTNHSVSALSLAASGHFWFFDNVTKEIISFDPASHGIKLRIDMKPVIPGAVAQTLIEDSNHRLWFSSWNGKMGVIDYKKNITTIFEYKNDDPLTVAGEGFWDMLEDDDHNIWLATAGGISKCNYSKTVYEIVPVTAHVPQFKNSILGGFSLDPRDNSWWLAAAGAGDISVIRYYPETGKYDFYDFQKAVKNRLGQMPGPVFAVCFMQGQPYACTHTGVWQLNEKTKQVLPFEKTFEGMPFIPFNYFVEHGDEVWFTTKKGLIKWNRLTNQAINIQWDVDSLPDGQKAWYSFPFFDKTGMAWLIAGFGWLGHVTPNNEAVLKYYIKNKPKELAAYITSPFIEDGVGNLWLASKGLGLYKYQIATGEMKIYDQSDGISSSTNQVAIDNSGLLWTAAMNKFAVFNPVTNSISQF
ncbi:MAG: two-component regulator propeller domain-containing protein, partial [Bacteroidota bacterium]